MSVCKTNFFPPPSNQSKILDEFCRDLEKRTGGGVKVDYFAGGSLLKPTVVFDGVISGIADIGYSHVYYTSGRMPVTEAAGLPLGYPSAWVAGQVLNDFYNEFKPKEFDQVKVLLLNTSTPSAIATAKKPVRTLEDMKKYHYDDTLATGTVAAFGTLGILIPPSTVLIVYGVMTEESIGKLFVAGILPGIILSILFAATVALLCRRNPSIGPPGAPSSWKEGFRSVTGIIEALILFALAIGGLFAGWFSPTQAGAIGAGGALIIGLARGQLSWKSFIEAGKDGLQTACMVLKTNSFY